MNKFLAEPTDFESMRIELKNKRYNLFIDSVAVCILTRRVETPPNAVGNNGTRVLDFSRRTFSATIHDGR